MPISWVTALKVIPWGDVIEAAPGIVKGARKFFAGTQNPEAEAPAPEASAQTLSPAQVAARLQQLEHQVAELTRQQQESAALIESLAEQNAKVVMAIDVLRVRTRLLLTVTAVMAVAVAALGWWAWR